MSYLSTTYDSESKTWLGVKKTPTFHPNATVGSILLQMLKNNPNKIVQISDDSGEKITGNEMVTKIIRATKHLIQMGYTQNDVFGFVAQNDKNLSPIVMSALTLGAAINPVHVSFATDDMIAMFGVTKPRIIFCESDVVLTVAEAVKEMKLSIEIVTIFKKVEGYKFVEEFFEEIDDEFFVPPILQDGLKQPAFILGSSGTTGTSKGVMLSHALVLDKFYIHFLNSEDTHLCVSPLYWWTGSASIVFSTIASCTRVITRENFNPKLTLKLIEKYNVTSIMTSPYQLALLLQCPEIESMDLKSLKKYLTGGALLPVHHQVEMNKRLPNGQVISGYGLTEVGGFVTLNENVEKAGSVGLLAANSEVKIVDENGKLLEPGTVGEILLRFNYMFSGYAGNPELADITMVIDSDFWIHSGDIGYIDKDGYMYITGRKRDVLKYFGHEISSGEIEAVISNHFGIPSVCVVGIPAKDISADLIAAVIVRPENKTFTEDDVYNIVADSLPDYMKLRGGVYFAKSLPLTISGKIIRRKVLEIAMEAHKNKIHQ